MAHEDFDVPNYGVVPVPKDPQGKLIDALSHCVWLLSAPRVSKAKALRGYQVDYVLRLSRAALKAVRSKPAVNS